MAKTKTKNKAGAATREMEKHAKSAASREQLYASALELVEHSEAEEALQAAKQLWALVKDSKSITDKLPALCLLGEISIELGAVQSAREYFEQAVRLDPAGEVPEALGGGAEKFLWLAQLCEEGGRQSVEWFERGVKALQHEIAVIENGQLPGLSEEDLLLMRVEKKRKLANALCGIVEVYMTDLSWDDDAEARCENLVTEAMAAEDETSPEVLQTLASVRLSQQRIGDAQSALKRSLETWIDLEPEDAAVPDFPTKISLSRLLMEAELLDEAMEVCHRLVQEDDQSIEAWYLGGWCQHLTADRKKDPDESNGTSVMDVGANDQLAAAQDQHDGALRESRRWLKMSLKLYAQQEYEDARLFEHATELVAGLDTVLGPEDEQAEDENEEWEGIEEDDEQDEDEEMHDS